MPEDKANALIAHVRRSIAACSTRALHEMLIDLRPAHRIVALAIRELAFPGLPDTVAVVRQSYQLQCAADGMMYQLALCRAARDLGLDVHLCRRGEEIATAAARLAVHRDDVESFVSGTGRPSGPALDAGTPTRICRWHRGARTAPSQDSHTVTAERWQKTTAAAAKRRAAYRAISQMKTGPIGRTADGLRQPDVFRARPFRPLPLVECDGLALAQFVESHARARRLVKEVPRCRRCSQ